MRDEQWYRERLVKSGVPEGLHDGYVRYLVYGYRPGDFLLAVLSNNLVLAVLRADADNRATLWAHGAFLYDDAPSQCWGSRATVEAWIQEHAAARAVNV